MSRNNAEFGWPHQIKGNVVKSRFSARREPETKKKSNKYIENEASVFSYGSPGKGVNGESSN